MAGLVVLLALMLGSQQPAPSSAVLTGKVVDREGGVISRRDFIWSVGATALGVGQDSGFGGTKPGTERVVEGIRLCWCPPGRFRMGSPVTEAGRRPDEGPVDVQLTRGFWIGKYEVTQGEWMRIAKAFPDRKPTAEFGLGDDIPVYWVSYAEADLFCARMTRYARTSGSIPDTWQFQLPTEAQWEYACRSGTTTASAFGDRLDRTHANIGAEPSEAGTVRPPVGRATPVGRYSANAWGIFDMHGNIFEWCKDWYHAQLPGGVDPDLSRTPGQPNRDGTFSRCRRGGAWNDPAVYCRSAMRLRYEPGRRSDHIGFRVAVVQT